MGTSLDLRIADAEGGLSYLDRYAAADRDYGYDAFIATVDALVMGRHTLDTVLGFGIPWPFGARRVVTCTTRPLPDGLPPQVSAHSGALSPLLASLAAEGATHVYLDGGALVRQGLREDVVDAIVLTIVPETIGAGVTLFDETVPRLAWRLVRHSAFPSGTVQLAYERVRA
jgi:dihydrofolate reductase